MSDGEAKWLKEGRVVLDEARRRAGLAAAWQALQERDAHGEALGPLPYTPEAIALFTRACEEDPDDATILHHLAIATHAWAWDRELAGDPGAGACWEQALGYWRQLIASPDFWRARVEKLARLAPLADQGILDTLRGGLYEELLDIHVEFVRHYFSVSTSERAAAHIDLIRRARIPPAVRRKLIDKLYLAMTASVPRMVAQQQFSAALGMVAQFLTLAPHYLPALQLAVEIGRDWCRSLSYVEHWLEILALEGRLRALSLPSALIALPGFAEAPLARAAVEDLAGELMRKYCDRAESHVARLEKGVFIQADHDAAEQLLETAIAWGRTVRPISTAASGLNRQFAGNLNQRMYLCLQFERPAAVEQTDDFKEKIELEVFYLERCKAWLDEAVGAHGDDAVLNGNLAAISEELEQKRQLAALAASINTWRGA